MATSKKPTREVFAANLKRAVNETKKATAEVAKKTEKTAQEVTEKAKESAKKTQESAKKTQESAKKSVKKVTETVQKKVQEKTAEVKVTTTFQWYGNDYKITDLVKKAEDAFKAEYNKPLKKIDIYIKPEDGRVYYFANGSIAGSVEL